jgi:hypothetical protein
MISEAPSNDSHKQPDEPKKLEELIRRPKAAFHWPSDCLSPFMDDGSDCDT